MSDNTDTLRLSPTARLTIGQAARMTGASVGAIHQWSVRYGWPSPRRSASGYRLFTRHEVEQIRWVWKMVRAGHHLFDLIVDGCCLMPAAAVGHHPVDLDFSRLPGPRSREAQCLRADLIAAIIRRQPGQVRFAIAARVRLAPVDREAAVDGVLRLAAEQLNNPSWLLEAMHA
jgi:hypothetical protein